MVADGMGGHVAGEVASRVAVEAIQAFIEETAGADKNRTWPFPFDPTLSLDANRIKAAFRLANRRIASTVAESQDLRGMFCGILPWTWFSASLNESAGVLISGGNLIKKVLFPAEILPIVTVLANMIHFFFGLVILAGFLVYYQRPQTAGELALFPVVVLVQLILTLGFALLLSALTVHFRDIRDILSNLLMLWFFATPIIYPWFQFEDPANPSNHVDHRDAAEGSTVDPDQRAQVRPGRDPAGDSHRAGTRRPGVLRAQPGRVHLLDGKPRDTARTRSPRRGRPRPDE